MKKNRIRLTESQLHNVIKESIIKILRESNGQNKYEYGKTIRHKPSPQTPIPYDATTPVSKVAREFINFYSNNSELVQSLYDDDWYHSDGFENEMRSADEKIGRAFANEMGYDYEYILPALEIAKKMINGKDYDFNINRIWGY